MKNGIKIIVATQWSVCLILLSLILLLLLPSQSSFFDKYIEFYTCITSISDQKLILVNSKFQETRINSKIQFGLFGFLIFKLNLYIMASSNLGIQIGSAWFQKKINLRPQHRGVHLVTEEILRQVPELCQFAIGLCHIQILHTSASLALNESWDPDVRDDMEMMLNKIIPEEMPYRHSCEGPDDMPAHVKACFLGSSLSIPITDGKLALGTWQGVWFCEHRNNAGSRKLVVTLTGCLRDSTRSPLSPVSPIASTSS